MINLKRINNNNKLETMLKIINQIKKDFIPLNCIDKKLVESCDIHSFSDFSGFIAEALVYQNLQNKKVDLIDLMFYSNLKYHIFKKNFGNIIYQNDTVKTEIDFCFNYEDSYYLVEVKSNKLNGFLGKINKNQKLIQDILKIKKINTILAIPLARKNIKIFEDIEKQGISILNLQYTRREFYNFTHNWYQSLRINNN
ncbi:MAG: hypothetical protein ACOC16_03065 [Nanoarchaeota archaeon]